MDLTAAGADREGWVELKIQQRKLWTPRMKFLNKMIRT